MEIEQLKEAFAKAYEWRADEADIDWKDTGYGKPLAYLNWAVAWRVMKEYYPDANYRLVETVEGSPLWNVNGYGMLKCAVSACGVEHIETFPIMDNRNNSVAIDKIDGRDINDSMQRGLTKAVARFGIGLYIYEGKCEQRKPAYKPQAKPTPSPQAKDPHAPLSASGKAYLDNFFAKVGMSRQTFIDQNGFDPYKDGESAKKALEILKPLNKGE